MKLWQKLHRETKAKIIFGMLYILVTTILNVYLSNFLHQTLSKEIDINSFTLNYRGFLNSINSIKTDKNHFMLFVSLETMLFLIGVFILTTNNKTYQSKLIQVTPNISIPAPAGQKQFGSARFMADREKEKAFSVCEINPNDELIKYLIDHGYDDLEKINLNKEGI